MLIHLCGESTPQERSATLRTTKRSSVKTSKHRSDMNIHHLAHLVLVREPQKQLHFTTTMHVRCSHSAAKSPHGVNTHPGCKLTWPPFHS